MKRKENLYESHEYLRLHRSERLEPYTDSFMSEVGLLESDFRLYPNIHALKSKIAKHHNVKEWNIAIGDGADRMIKQTFESFATRGSSVVSVASPFPMYEVYSELYGNNLVTVDFALNYTEKYETAGAMYVRKMDIDGMITAITDDTSLCVVTNPNSPIGFYTDLSDIKTIANKCRETQTILLIDETYIDFTDRPSAIELIDEYKNIIVIRSFSKGLGAAGIRVGYAIGDKDLIDILLEWRRMFEITGPSCKFAEYLLSPVGQENVKNYVNKTKEEKEAIIEILHEKGYEVIDSEANWIHFNNLFCGDTSIPFFKSHDDVLFKETTFPKDGRDGWIRLTVGAGLTENETFLNILSKL